jgi:trimeric autotransporter adhesin
LVVGFNQTTISSGVLVALSVQVNAGVALGGYSLSIENTAATGAGENAMGFSASDGSVTVTDSGSGPGIAAVANAASYGAGTIAPGEMVVIYGSSLGSGTLTTKQLDASGFVSTALAGTRVLFDGTAAPLLYASANQVSAIVPYGLDGHTQTSMQVEYQGIRSAPFVLSVIQASQGIFTADSSGRGQGAIVNQDGTLNTPENPAVPGSVVSIYGTGDGQTLPGGMDGYIVPGLAELRYTMLPVTASIGGQNAEVEYTGSGVGEVCGLFQANVRVPEGLASGSLPVILTVGGASTQTGVTIAVH